MNLNYKPMFLHNISFSNGTVEKEAKAVCGDNRNCLFDIAVTGDLSIGRNTRNTDNNNFVHEQSLGKFFCIKTGRFSERTYGASISKMKVA